MIESLKGENQLLNEQLISTPSNEGITIINNATELDNLEELKQEIKDLKFNIKVQ